MPEGRTAVAGVFAVGDGAALGGARVAQARGRLAGLAAARELGFAAPADAAARGALARAEAFQDALWRVFAAPPIADRRRGHRLPLRGSHRRPAARRDRRRA